MMFNKTSTHFLLPPFDAPTTDPEIRAITDEIVGSMNKLSHAALTNGLTMSANGSTAPTVTAESIKKSMVEISAAMKVIEDADAKYEDMYNTYYAKKHGFDFNLGARLITHPDTFVAEPPFRYRKQVLVSNTVPVGECILASGDVIIDPRLEIRINPKAPGAVPVFDPFRFEHERDI